ncbi:GNAT family N-acetyltransferase [Microcella frigidaquae]|uniref:Ribosomal protein S18 acetylase RimI-like enzyme n=1 Tax=Microcella frigidaquae TaxID=424758 RepID=A0A840X7H0_9MICO|nr:GNAT family N-acetyltransferase [Microcella frigidaquae]MBB5617105.1 ribosomal protein S18 acetylase RimI-like enzyme [Microcella frigidaquae]NHN45308.1 GNAT family N-acetyltransferase [Microcella frigidaquae]
MSSASATGVVVRAIEPRDHQRWRELFTAYGVFYETAFDDAVLDGVWAWLMDAGHPLVCLVAERDGALVGFAHLREQPDTFTAGPGWYLDDLYTEPAVRGSGAGTALLEAIAAHARSHGGGTIRWITAADNTRAQGVYDRLATRTSWVTYEWEV